MWALLNLGGGLSSRLYMCITRHDSFPLISTTALISNELTFLSTLMRYGSTRATSIDRGSGVKRNLLIRTMARTQRIAYWNILRALKVRLFISCGTQLALTSHRQTNPHKQNDQQTQMLNGHTQLMQKLCDNLGMIVLLVLWPLHTDYTEFCSYYITSLERKLVAKETQTTKFPTTQNSIDIHLYICRYMQLVPSHWFLINHIYRYPSRQSIHSSYPRLKLLTLIMKPGKVEDMNEEMTTDWETKFLLSLKRNMNPSMLLIVTRLTYFRVCSLEKLYLRTRNMFSVVNGQREMKMKLWKIFCAY